MSDPAVAPDRRGLEDERDFLLCSLRDLDIERDVGDLDDDDYNALRDRYTARAAVVLRALAAATGGEVTDEATTGKAGTGQAATDAAFTEGDCDPVAGPDRRRRLRRRVVVAGLVGVFAVAGVVTVVAQSANRLPGETATGSLTLGKAQEIQRQLAQAAVLETSGRSLDALRIYHQVLAADPTQAQALAESGWLEFQAGIQARRADVVAAGEGQEQAAVRADPGSFGPHLYLGSMLLVEGDARAAVAEFRTYLADDPPESNVAEAAPFITRAFMLSGLAPPPLPGS
ncbi:MAG TPA: hypothetical protein VED63_01055 [Acidimicrobiales bacterium]|nr:hypothetical protein [Acidimicrobiales bacterium]